MPPWEKYQGELYRAAEWYNLLYKGLILASSSVSKMFKVQDSVLLAILKCMQDIKYALVTYIHYNTINSTYFYRYITHTTVKPNSFSSPFSALSSTDCTCFTSGTIAFIYSFPIPTSASPIPHLLAKHKPSHKNFQPESQIAFQLVHSLAKSNPRLFPIDDDLQDSLCRLERVICRVKFESFR